MSLYSIKGIHWHLAADIGMFRQALARRLPEDQLNNNFKPNLGKIVSVEEGWVTLPEPVNVGSHTTRDEPVYFYCLRECELILEPLFLT